MSHLADHYIAVIVAIVIAAFFIAVARAGSTKAQIARAKKEGRHRIVEINGRRYHAIRKTETIVRTEKGHGRAILLMVGRQRDPDLVNGRMEFKHRWIKIRSITRSGISKHERWVRSKAWFPDGTKDVDYLLPAAANDA
ncbi:MAG: hypothetical protein HYX63_17575 [Gammaproteobacteria bacterium]|nr:hypothetical protein [Gammaproteobacteria bacterium]